MVLFCYFSITLTLVGKRSFNEIKLEDMGLLNVLRN